MNTADLTPPAWPEELPQPADLRTHVDQLAGQPDFFPRLADYLAATLRMDYVLIGRLTSPDTIRTVGLSAAGHAAGEMEYTLNGTPCQNVVGRSLCFYPSNVRYLFPDDKELQDLEIESYLGKPLNSPDSGHPMGLIVLMSRQTIPNAGPVGRLLDSIRPRCEAELARYQPAADLAA